MDSKDPSVWREVFSPLGQAIAFFGGLGALVNAVVTKRSWLDTIRIVLVGAAVAFGLGTVSPHILRRVMPELSEVNGAGLGLLTASAFIVGLVAIALVERMLRRVESTKPSSGWDDESF